MNQAPSILAAGINFINLEWEAWNQDTDVGDPPLVAYVIYVDLNTTEGRIEMVDSSFTSIIVRNLQANTTYEFRVAAVREGDGGIGPPSPPVSATTLPTSMQCSLHSTS